MRNQNINKNYVEIVLKKLNALFYKTYLIRFLNKTSDGRNCSEVHFHNVLHL